MKVFSSIYFTWNGPAIIGVLSPTRCSTRHAVFWDGEKITDPSGLQNVDRGYVNRNGLEFTQSAQEIVSMLAATAWANYAAPPSFSEEL